MLTDPKRGLTADAVRKELETLDLQQAKKRDDLAIIQREEKSALTESHRATRELLKQVQAGRRGELAGLLNVLTQEAEEDKEPDSPDG